MAPRAHWKGHLRLSLVSCPIQLFPATSEREHHEGFRRRAVCLSILRSFCFVDTHRGFSAHRACG